jgi:protein-tyrosine-phosphatase
MNILFICKYNRFRSKIAESYFNQINRNVSFNVASAGIIFDQSPPSKFEIDNAKKENIAISQKKFKKADQKTIDWADLVVIVADDISKEDIFNKKQIYWNISDDHKSSQKKIKEIILKIKKEVELLNFELNDSTIFEKKYKPSLIDNK